MKKILLILLTLGSFSSFSQDSRHTATIECKFQNDGYHYDYLYDSGEKVSDGGSHWIIRFNHCSDGHRDYLVTFKQHKILNFDFIRDKLVTDGNFKLNCLGTDVRGVYHGLSAKLAYLFGFKAGAFVSLLGQQSVCGLAETTVGVPNSGLDYSPLKLIIEDQ